VEVLGAHSQDFLHSVFLESDVDVGNACLFEGESDGLSSTWDGGPASKGGDGRERERQGGEVEVTFNLSIF